MNNVLLLTKIYLKSLFTFTIDKNDKSIRKILKNNSKLFILIFAFLYIAYFVFQFSLESAEAFISLNAIECLYALFFLLSTMIILMNNLFKAKETFYCFKDYDLLMSLPIKREEILLSKLLTSYIFNLLYVIIFMIPCLIAVIIKSTVTIPFIIIYLILALLIPIIPMVIANIIGIIISYISNKFKLKNLMTYIFFMIIISLSFYMSNTLSNNTEMIDIANLATSLINKLNSYYPIINIYINSIKDYNIISIILSISIPLIILYIFIKLLNKFYLTIRNVLIKDNIKKDYKIKEYKNNNPIIGLYKKELKRFISSPNYVLNTSLGSLALIIFSIIILFISNEKIESLLEIENISEIIKNFAPYLIAATCALTCTTHSSISLEGKNIWILKSIPITEMKIFISKILVTLTITIPSIIISTISFTIKFNLDIKSIILCLIIPILYSLLIALLGLIINLIYPMLNFDNEIKVIKQSSSAILTMMLSLIITGIIASLVLSQNINESCIILIPILIILNIIEIIILKTIGIKKFKNL